MVNIKRLGVLLGMVLISTTLWAAENPVITMQLLSYYTYMPASDAYSDYMLPSLSLSIASPRSGNVRGEVVLKTPYTSLTSGSATTIVNDILNKAYFKARFPSFRLTAGKTRLSWGDGILFNAGDVLYGSSDTSVSLTQAELRSETGWMTSINYPMGFFSFAEAVILPSIDTHASHMGAGFRYYTNVGNTKVEAGYLTSYETERLHKPYVAMQGNIGPDWYMASSLSIPQSGDIATETKESWLISGGLYHLQDLGNDKTLSLRLEFLTRPFGNWELTSQSDSDCALLLYPEIVYTPSSSLSWSLRSIISPLDLSCNITAGVSWSVFEGFTAVGYLSSPFGDSSDLFSWNAATSAVSLVIGASWIF